MRTSWRIILAGLGISAALSAQVRLTGRVVNDVSSPVTRAVVVLRVEGEAQARARTFTDPAGAFGIQLAEPGEYLLDAEAAGFYPVKGFRVTVAEAGSEVTVSLAPVREFADSVDVTSAPVSLGLDRTTAEQSLTGAQMLDIPVPVTHDLKAMMRVLPGVVQDNATRVHLNGGAENQTLYLLDGFNIGDPLTGNFDTRVTLEGIQSMNVETGALSPEYGKGSAGVISVNMKTGDDRLRYSATNFIPGLENDKGLRVGSWYPRANLSGPLRRGRVWFSDSLAAQYVQTIIRDLPVGQDKASSIRYNNYLHVQANLRPSNIASFGFLGSLWTGARTGLSALDPPATTVDRRARQWFAYAKDQQYFGAGAALEFGVASNRTFSREAPHGTDLYVYTPFGRQGNYYAQGTQRASRDQGIVNGYLPSFHWLGVHQIKAGGDVDWLSYGQNLNRTGVEWMNANLALVRRVLFAGNGDVGRDNLETAAYVQDSWRVRENVLFEAGVRSDWDRLVGEWTMAPRAGVAWSPARLANTRVSAGYGISYDATDLSLFTRPSDQYPVTYYYPPYGVADQPVQSRFVIDRGPLHRQRFINWTAAVDHRLGAHTFVHVQATRRWVGVCEFTAGDGS